MNTKPTQNQEATGDDGILYRCTVAGDDIVDGVVRAGEQWIQAGDGTGRIFTRSERDILADRFDGATFL